MYIFNIIFVTVKYVVLRISIKFYMGKVHLDPDTLTFKEHKRQKKRFRKIGLFTAIGVVLGVLLYIGAIFLHHTPTGVFLKFQNNRLVFGL